MRTRTLVATHVVAVAVGVSAAAGTGAFASSSQDIHLQTLLAARQASDRIGPPNLPSPITVNGELDRLNHSVDALFLQLQKVCRATNTTC
jgi:hypothetical protein